jgi:hypothetical protein
MFRLPTTTVFKSSSSSHLKHHKATPILNAILFFYQTRNTVIFKISILFTYISNKSLDFCLFH